MLHVTFSLEALEARTKHTVTVKIVLSFVFVHAFVSAGSAAVAAAELTTYFFVTAFASRHLRRASAKSHSVSCVAGDQPHCHIPFMRKNWLRHHFQHCARAHSILLIVKFNIKYTWRLEVKYGMPIVYSVVHWMPDECPKQTSMRQKYAIYRHSFWAIQFYLFIIIIILRFAFCFPFFSLLLCCFSVFFSLTLSPHTEWVQWRWRPMLMVLIMVMMMLMVMKEAMSMEIYVHHAEAAGPNAWILCCV